MSLFTSTERSAALSRRLLRVATYFAFVGLVFLALGARAVWGSVGEGALELGAGLVELGEVAGPAYTVRLNGAPMQVSSVTTDEGATAVLDRFERECREHSGGLADEHASLPEAIRARLPAALLGPLGIGVVRKERDGHGIVACLARDGAGGRAAIADGLKEFERTGDLSALGHVRYVAAEQRADGKTHVVSMWSDAPMHVGAMFPSEGDSPGEDPGAPVRPPQSRRLLAASVDGAPFGVHVYDSDAAPDAVLAHYDRAMPDAGWRPIGRMADKLPGGRAYTRAGVDLMVFTGAKPGGCTVSLVAMPPR